MILIREEPRSMVVIPDHKELDRGTLRAILKQSGLTETEFLQLL